jgi:hypothetical protein
MLVDKMQHPLKMRQSDKKDSLKSIRPFNPFK